MAHELTSRTYVEKKWWVVIVKDQLGFSRRETFCIRAGSRQAVSQFLNTVSINLKKVPQMPVSGFLNLNHSGRNWPNPGCSFYLPVSMCRNSTVVVGGHMYMSRKAVLLKTCVIKKTEL